jgi:hypothetical protein
MGTPPSSMLATPQDKLESTSWNDRDTIDSFTHRFMLRLSNFNESIYASSNNNSQPYEPDQITILYLKLLVTTMPTNHDLYREVQVMYTRGERDLVRQGRLETNTTEVQRDLQTIELTLRANTYENRPTERPSNRERYTRQKTVHTKPPHAANVALQSSKYKKIKCWECGHGHQLRNCPTSEKNGSHCGRSIATTNRLTRLETNIKTTPTEAPIRTSTNATIPSIL